MVLGRPATTRIVQGLTVATGTTETPGGILVPSDEVCATAPSQSVRRCIDEACSYDEPLARAFHLSERCESALGVGRVQTSGVLAATHAEAEQTVVELDRRARNDGALWSAASPCACARYDLGPAEDGRVSLQLREPEAGGGYVVDKTLYELQPLLQRAVRHGDSRTRYDAEGTLRGMGVSGLSRTRVPTYMAVGAVLLD